MLNVQAVVFVTHHVPQHEDRREGDSNEITKPSRISLGINAMQAVKPNRPRVQVFLEHAGLAGKPDLKALAAQRHRIVDRELCRPSECQRVMDCQDARRVRLLHRARH